MAERGVESKKRDSCVEAESTIFFNLKATIKWENRCGVKSIPRYTVPQVAPFLGVHNSPRFTTHHLTGNSDARSRKHFSGALLLTLWVTQFTVQSTSKMHYSPSHRQSLTGCTTFRRQSLPRRTLYHSTNKDLQYSFLITLEVVEVRHPARDHARLAG